MTVEKLFQSNLSLAGDQQGTEADSETNPTSIDTLDPRTLALPEDQGAAASKQSGCCVPTLLSSTPSRSYSLT